ncbi:MAG: hypothetical protein IKG88_07870, partial [Bacteroidales bacterium]|nr:hypothetical protein [Bacteroidales bacterium]
RADHQLKALLHMCALVAATRMKSGRFAEYYQRKTAEGKNKMSVLNAVSVQNSCSQLSPLSVTIPLTIKTSK